MEKFIVRGPLKTTATKNKRKSPGPEREEADSGAEGSGRSKKRPKLDASHQSKTPLVGASWKHIRAEGLNCDYRILFNKAEADRIFQELEKEVEYFEAGEFTKLHIFGKWHNIPRKQVTYGDAGLTYTYSGVTFSPKPWIPVLGHIRDQIQLTTGDTFNFVLINRGQCRRSLTSYCNSTGAALDYVCQLLLSRCFWTTIPTSHCQQSYMILSLWEQKDMHFCI
uniref:DNA oxidative demethylase ALKBH2 isoform X3 n=1 Tax=Podarcis muralis TaxID=64176 RepID=UPI0010A06599|nr:DNA oxidative demethylase ALKBH2 isoform X3 [Podarcis muralis]